MNVDKQRIVVSFAESFGDQALKEIEALGALVRCDSESAVVELPEVGGSWFEQLRRSRPIFLRHAFPVQVSISARNQLSLGEALSRFKASSDQLIDRGSYAVQVSVEGVEFSTGDVAKAIEEQLVARGVTCDRRERAAVLCILVTPREWFIGVSSVEESGNPWAFGRCRLRDEDQQVSRAEHKLIEAQAIFGFERMQKGTVLDLGAAPGGWTRIVRSWGAEVHAVDPAELDPRVKSLSGVRHFKMTVDHFVREERHAEYCFVLNDMRADAPLSARWMVNLAPQLRRATPALMTLKLGERDVQRDVREATGILEESYEVLGIRHLYHNRQEVSVYLRRRS